MCLSVVADFALSGLFGPFLLLAPLAHYNGSKSHPKTLHGLGQPPHAVELVACDAVDKPGKVAKGKEACHLPVGTRPSGNVRVTSLRLLCCVFPEVVRNCTQPWQKPSAKPPEHAKEEEEAEARPHEPRRAEDVQIEVVRMLNGDEILGWHKSQGAEGRVVHVRASTKDGPVPQYRKGKVPQVPAPVVLEGLHAHAAGRVVEEQKARKPENKDCRHKHLPAPETHDKRPPHKGSRHEGHKPAACSCPVEGEKAWRKHNAKQYQGLFEGEAFPENEPHPKGRDQHKGEVVADAVVANGCREPACMGGIAHGKVKARYCLPDAA